MGFSIQMVRPGGSLVPWGPGDGRVGELRGILSDAKAHMVAPLLHDLCACTMRVDFSYAHRWMHGSRGWLLFFFVPPSLGWYELGLLRIAVPR